MPYINEQKLQDLQNDGSSNPSKASNPRPLRGTGWSPDVLDDQIGYDSPLTTLFPGLQRQIWKIDPPAVSGTRVTSIRSSVSAQASAANSTFKSGIVSGPTTTVTSFTVIPNMTVSLTVEGPVQISFFLTASTANANDTAGFAIFRDGLQITRTQNGSSPSAGVPFPITISGFVDNPQVGQVHVYDARWQAGASTLTAVGQQRTIQAISLHAN